MSFSDFGRKAISALTTAATTKTTTPEHDRRRFSDPLPPQPLILKQHILSRRKSTNTNSATTTTTTATSTTTTNDEDRRRRRTKPPSSASTRASRRRRQSSDGDSSTINDDSSVEEYILHGVRPQLNEIKCPVTEKPLSLYHQKNSNSMGDDSLASTTNSSTTASPTMHNNLDDGWSSMSRQTTKDDEDDDVSYSIHLNKNTSISTSADVMKSVEEIEEDLDIDDRNVMAQRRQQYKHSWQQQATQQQQQQHRQQQQQQPQLYKDQQQQKRYPKHYNNMPQQQQDPNQNQFPSPTSSSTSHFTTFEEYCSNNNSDSNSNSNSNSKIRRTSNSNNNSHNNTNNNKKRETKAESKAQKSSQKSASKSSQKSKLSTEVALFQKMVGELDLVSKESTAISSPKAMWKSRTLLRSAQDTNRDLQLKVLHDNEYETTTTLVAKAAHKKIQRDYARASTQLESIVADIERRQQAEISYLTTDAAKAGGEDEDFFERAMRERQHELDNIQQSMHQVNDIYGELAHLVDDQQDQIDQLEDINEEVKTDTKAGLERIQQGMWKLCASEHAVADTTMDTNDADVGVDDIDDDDDIRLYTGKKGRLEAAAAFMKKNHKFKSFIDRTATVNPDLFTCMMCRGPNGQHQNTSQSFEFQRNYDDPTTIDTSLNTTTDVPPAHVLDGRKKKKPQSPQQGYHGRYENTQNDTDTNKMQRQSTTTTATTRSTNNKSTTSSSSLNRNKKESLVIASPRYQKEENGNDTVIGSPRYYDDDNDDDDQTAPNSITSSLPFPSAYPSSPSWKKMIPLSPSKIEKIEENATEVYQRGQLLVGNFVDHVQEAARKSTVLKDLDAETLRKRLSCTPQSEQLFPGTNNDSTTTDNNNVTNNDDDDYDYHPQHRPRPRNEKQHPRSKSSTSQKNHHHHQEQQQEQQRGRTKSRRSSSAIPTSSSSSSRRR